MKDTDMNDELTKLAARFPNLPFIATALPAAAVAAQHMGIL